METALIRCFELAPTLRVNIITESFKMRWEIDTRHEVARQYSCRTYSKKTSAHVLRIKCGMEYSLCFLAVINPGYAGYSVNDRRKMDLNATPCKRVDVFRSADNDTVDYAPKLYLNSGSCTNKQMYH